MARPCLPQSSPALTPIPAIITRLCSGRTQPGVNGVHTRLLTATEAAFMLHASAAIGAKRNEWPRSDLHTCTFTTSLYVHVFCQPPGSANMKRRRMRRRRRRISPCRTHHRQKSIGFLGCTRTLLFFLLTNSSMRVFFQSKMKSFEDNFCAGTLLSICPQGVKYYTYVHVSVYASCMSNLPIEFARVRFEY